MKIKKPFLTKKSNLLDSRFWFLDSGRGFTLIELMISIAIIVILGFATFGVFSGSPSTKDLANATKQITAVLRQAQTQSVQDYQGAAWGVHFASPTGTTPFYALFSNAYATATTAAFYRLPSSLGMILVPSGLVGYWPFDEGSGGTARDYSVSGKNGTWFGTKTGTSDYYSAGVVGKWAGTFDGSTDYVSVATSSAFPSGNAARTISLWLRRLADTGNTAYELGGYGGPNVDNSSFYVMMVGSSTLAGQPAHSIIIDDYYFSTAWFGTGFVISDNNWHHVAAETDGNSNTSVYVDGVRVANGSHTWSTVVNTAFIGKSQQGGPSFPGLIDDVRIYNRALSAAEITQLYNGSADILFSPIIGSIPSSTGVEFYSLSQPSLSSTISVAPTGAASF